MISSYVNSQIGINSLNPSSTLEVKGSIEGNYKDITEANYNILDTDYHISFSGNNNSLFTLPNPSTDDNSINDFRGRKYYIKNNSTNSVLTLTTLNTGNNLRLGGQNPTVNNIIISPGTLAILTANGNRGWDLEISGITELGKQRVKLSIGPRFTLFGPNEMRSNFGITGGITIPFVK